MSSPEEINKTKENGNAVAAEAGPSSKNSRLLELSASRLTAISPEPVDNHSEGDSNQNPCSNSPSPDPTTPSNLHHSDSTGNANGVVTEGTVDLTVFAAKTVEIVEINDGKASNKATPSSTTAPKSKNKSTASKRSAKHGKPTEKSGSASVDSNGGDDGGGKCLDAFKKRMEKEWDSVHLLRHIGGSYVFKHVFKVSVKHEAKKSDFFAESISLQNADDELQWCCMLCKEEGKELGRCLLKMKPGVTSNSNKHLHAVHEERLKELKEEERNKQKRKLDDGLQHADPKQQPKKSKAVNQVSIRELCPPKQSPKVANKATRCAEAQSTLHKKIAKFINNGSHPDNVVVDPNLRDIVTYSIKNAAYLQNYKHLGIRKYITIQCSSFSDLLTSVNSLIVEIRDWWVERTGSRQPFIVVAHDVWDGKRRQINGLTIFFVHPISLVLYRIPIALTPPSGKTAIELSDTSMQGLERVGIESQDVFRMVNDNCRTAAATGRLIVANGDDIETRADEDCDAAEDDNPVDGSCDMHYSSLFAGLALSLVERRKNGVVCNRWPPFQDLYQKLKEAAKFVCDKKNKRFDQYAKTVRILGEAIVITIPNGTRVAGAILLTQDSLRSMHCLRFFATKSKKFEVYNLTSVEWNQVAEFEAIMKKAHVLCYEVQTDRPELGAETILLLTLVKVHYEEVDEYEVVDIEKEWSTHTPFHLLPKVKKTTKRSKASNELPLLTEHSIALVARYIKSYNEYFKKVNPDRLVAMITHPFLGTTGFTALKALRPSDGEELHSSAKKLLHKSISIVARNLKTCETQSQMADEAKIVAPTSKLDRLKMVLEANKATAAANSNVEERVSRSVEEFVTQQFDPSYEIRQQRMRMGEGTEDIDWERIENASDLLYISSKFDLLEWWKSVGCSKFPLVFLAALPFLALPPSNAFLERIFSTCTWFDDPLRQRLKPKRFEMSILLAVNKVFIEEFKEVVSDERAKEIVEKVIDMFDKSDGFSNRLDLGFDAHAGDFLIEEDGN